MCADPDAARLPNEHRALIGARIAGRYLVRDVAGTGAMATVFRAEHIALRRDVAVKVQTAMTSRFRELDARFERETRILSLLDHPNCVRAIDCGRTDAGLRFLVMPLIEGVELASLLTGPHEPSLVIRRVRQILAGLAHAHARGIVHRDLKPENILVTRDHRDEELLLIVDFGIGQLARSKEPRMTEPGLVLGTPEYISPEQANGRGADARSDLYALGCIMYEMLQGRPPFDEDDPDRLLRDHARKPAPQLDPRIPLQLRKFVARLLEKDPNRRFSSAATAARSLSRIDATAGLPPSTSDDVSPPVTRAWSRRRVWPIAATLLIATGVGAAVLRPVDGAAPQPAGPSVFETAVPVVDRLLAQGRTDDARLMAERLLDVRPHEPKLLWRAGRAHTALGQSDVALERYREAVQRHPSLLDDVDFYRELVELMRVPSQRERAVTIAIRDTHHATDRFLAELVNDRLRPLPFTQRQRALEHLRALPASAALIDESIQRDLDLEQAAATPTPCLTYATAVYEIAAATGRQPADIVAARPPPEPANAFDRLGCVALTATTPRAPKRFRS